MANISIRCRCINFKPGQPCCALPNVKNIVVNHGERRKIVKPSLTPKGGLAKAIESCNGSSERAAVVKNGEMPKVANPIKKHKSTRTKTGDCDDCGLAIGKPSQPKKSKKKKAAKNEKLGTDTEAK